MRELKHPDVTRREAARLVFWPRRSDGAIFHMGVAGGAVGIAVAFFMFHSPELLLLAASLVLGSLGAVLGRGVGLALLLCGYLH